MEVKQSTSNNLIYTELNRPNIVSVIKDRQYNFMTKFFLLKEDKMQNRYDQTMH